MGTHLLAYGSYLPTYRLGGDSGVRTTRVVASFDEDATTMAVAAASAAHRSADDLPAPASVLLATTSPPYLDKSSAVTAATALHLPPDVFAADVAGAARSGVAAVRGAIADGGLALLADVRVGKPGSADERGGADGAAALLFGDAPGIAAVLAVRSRSAELLDRWRDPLRATGDQWEERFGFERYAALVREVAAEALDAAGLADADHVVLTSPNAAVGKRAGSLVKGQVSTTASPVGHAGAADLGLALAAVLDVAAPDQTILVISAADGCDAIVLRTTDLLPSRRQPVPLATQLAGGCPVPYPTYLSWRGLLERELPRRPEPDRPAAPPSARGGGWKFGFSGARCTACGFVHLPPVRVCRSCGTQDAMEVQPASGLRGTVATFTVDRLAYSPSPPVVDVVVDVDGGGRCALEVADADPEAFAVGTRVEMAFRSLFTAGGVHNYFWKARRVEEEDA